MVFQNLLSLFINLDSTSHQWLHWYSILKNILLQDLIFLLIHMFIVYLFRNFFLFFILTFLCKLLKSILANLKSFCQLLEVGLYFLFYIIVISLVGWLIVIGSKLFNWQRIAIGICVFTNIIVVVVVFVVGLGGVVNRVVSKIFLSNRLSVSGLWLILKQIGISIFWLSKLLLNHFLKIFLINNLIVFDKWIKLFLYQFFNSHIISWINYFWLNCVNAISSWKMLLRFHFSRSIITLFLRFNFLN